MTIPRSAKIAMVIGGGAAVGIVLATHPIPTPALPPVPQSFAPPSCAELRASDDALNHFLDQHSGMILIAIAWVALSSFHTVMDLCRFIGTTASSLITYARKAAA